MLLLDFKAAATEMMTLKNALSLKLVCLDFDGTILTYDEHPDGVIDGEICNVLNHLKEGDVHWVPNSGRRLDSQLEIIERSQQFGLQALPVACLCSETLVYLRNKDRYDALEPYNSDTLLRIGEFQHRLQLFLKVQMGEWFTKYSIQQSYVESDGFAFLLDQSTPQVETFHAEIIELVKQFGEGEAIRNGGWVSVIPEGLGKGVITSTLMDQLKLNRSQVLAVGNDHNDVSMLNGNCAAYVGCPADSARQAREAVEVAGGYVAEERGSEGSLQVLRNYLEQ